MTDDDVLTGRFDPAFWDEHYASHEPARERRPTPHLVHVAEALTPGTALDAGCGEGADAIWLAARGWSVTAVDVSATALGRARSRAQGVAAVDWRVGDLSSWTPTAPAFDLVSSQYVHLATDQAYETCYRRLASWVAPAGTLLLAGHGASGHVHDGVEQPHFSADLAASGLDPLHWDVEVTESDHDVVLHAQRRSDAS